MAFVMNFPSIIVNHALIITGIYDSIDGPVSINAPKNTEF